MVNNIVVIRKATEQSTEHTSTILAISCADAITDYSDGETVDTDDEKLKCYMACMFEQGGMLDDQGVLHLEYYPPYIATMDDYVRTVMQNMLDSCPNPQGSNKCELSYSLHRCWKLADLNVN